MDNDNLDKEKLLSQKIIFCTECGAVLENFCFSSKAKDPEAIRKNLEQCKKSGKFKGDFCSRLFIVDDSNLESLWEGDEPIE